MALRAGGASLFAALSLLVLVLLGCNSGGSGPLAAPPPPTASPTVHLEPGDMFVTEMMRKELEQLEDPLQAQLAADGKLTRDEYEQLVYATIQCIEESGSRVNDRVNSVGTHSFVVSTPGGVVGAPAGDCQRKYWDPLAAWWPMEHPIPEVELIRAEKALEACLRAEGIEPPPDDHGGIDTMAIIRQGGAAARVMVDCSRPISEEFGWHGWHDH